MVSQKQSLRAPSASSDPGALVRNPDVGIDAIGAFFDAFGDDHEARYAAMQKLSWGEQRELYAKAGESGPLTLSHYVPEAVGACVGVAHDGWNSLPLPAPMRRFQKVFCRPDEPVGSRPRLFGYNEGLTRKPLGPGYFVLYETGDIAGWRHRGGVVVDYFQVPDGDVPPDWPPILPNSRGLQRLVFHRMRDYIRRVSEHVTIGAAYKATPDGGDRRIEQFFLLCRCPGVGR